MKIIIFGAHCIKNFSLDSDTDEFKEFIEVHKLPMKSSTAIHAVGGKRLLSEIEQCFDKGYMHVLGAKQSL